MSCIICLGCLNENITVIDLKGLKFDTNYSLPTSPLQKTVVLKKVSIIDLFISTDALSSKLLFIYLTQQIMAITTL